MIEILALDVGQTGVRTTLTFDDITIDGPDLPGILSSEPLLPQVAGHIATALEGRPARAVAIGASGLGPQDCAARLAGLLQTPVETIAIAHDSITSYLGALGPVSGAVVAAGTGAVTLAVGAERMQRVDGWGHLLGDEGAGFWIGRAALSAVLKAHDGRGPATALTAHAVEEFGDLDGLYLRVQSDPNRVALIASWARHVAQLAAHDAVAEEISVKAARLLADSVAAGIRTAQAEAVASYVGNVFRNRLLTAAFECHLSEHIPGIEVRMALGNGLAGAQLLPHLNPTSPLARATDYYTVAA